MVLLPFGLASAFISRSDLRRGRMLLWPLVVTVLVMGLFNHRRDYYMLALMPPMTILCARAVVDMAMVRGGWRITRRAGGVAGWLAVASIVVCTALGMTDWVWGTKRFRDERFARQAAAMIAPGDAVFVVSTDRAKLVYAANRPVVTAENLDSLRTAEFNDRRSLDTGGERWLLTTRAVLRGMRGFRWVRVVLSAEVHPGDNEDVLCRVLKAIEEE